MKRVLIFGIMFIVLLIILVVYLNISRQVDQNELVLSGIIEADENDLSFRISGLLTAIYFDEGDHIDSGAVVAMLDKEELDAAVDQASKSYQALSSSIDNLQISLETIERNLKKIEALIPSGAATQSDYDDLFDRKRQTRAQVKQAESSRKAAEAAVNMARIRRGYADLASFAEGTVISRNNQPGEIVMPGAPVLTLANLEDLIIKVYLPEKQLGKVKLGQTVEIEIDSHPDEDFPGTISHISDKAEFTPKNVQTKEERIKQVFEIEIASHSQGGLLKLGMPCDVVISLE